MNYPPITTGPCAAGCNYNCCDEAGNPTYSNSASPLFAVAFNEAPLLVNENIHWTATFYTGDGLPSLHDPVHNGVNVQLRADGSIIISIEADADPATATRMQAFANAFSNRLARDYRGEKVDLSQVCRPEEEAGPPTREHFEPLHLLLDQA